MSPWHAAPRQGNWNAFRSWLTTNTIPIVFATSADPVGLGLVHSLARPEGNVTGLSLQAVELAGKRLELLKETVPRLSRVALLFQAGYPPDVRTVPETQEAARRFGIPVQALGVRTSDEFDNAFADVA